MFLRRSLLSLLCCLTGVGLAVEARAGFEVFYIAPDESRVRIDSIRFESRVPWGQLHVHDAEEQGGLPGTTPGVLPGGGASNGFETFLDGKLLVDNELQTLSRLTIEMEASSLDAGDMGSWLPGSTPANAGFQLTTSVLCIPGSCVPITIDIAAAIRDFRVAPDGLLTLASLGPDLWSVSGSLTLTPIAGRIDYDSTIPGFADSTPIPTGGFPFLTATISASDGRYEVLAPDLAKLTLPFTTDLLNILPEDMALELDTSLNAAFASGEIVAYSQPVPEPGSALMLGPGLALLLALHARRVRRSGRRA